MNSARLVAFGRKAVLTSMPRRGLSNYVVLGDTDTLKDIVSAADSKVLYFTATWCPPCKMIAPVFERLSKEFPATKFVKIDIDEHESAASEHQIRSVPTFKFYQGDALKGQVEKFSFATLSALS